MLADELEMNRVITYCLRFRFFRGSVSLKLRKGVISIMGRGSGDDYDGPSELNAGPVDGEHGVSTIGMSDYFLHFICCCLSDRRWQFLHNLELAGHPFPEKIFRIFFIILKITTDCI